MQKISKEISSSLRKLSEDRLVIVSFVHCNVEYNHALLPVFNKRIEITEDIDNHRLLQTNVYNRSFNRKVLSHSAALRNEDLTLVPTRWSINTSTSHPIPSLVPGHQRDLYTRLSLLCNRVKHLGRETDAFWLKVLIATLFPFFNAKITYRIHWRAFSRSLIMARTPDSSIW